MARWRRRRRDRRPFLLADLLEINRDLFYGPYAIAVSALTGLWARATGYDRVTAVKRRWPWAAGLGALFAGVLGVMGVPNCQGGAMPSSLRVVFVREGVV